MQLVKRTFETHNSFIVHLFLCTCMCSCLVQCILWPACCQLAVFLKLKMSCLYEMMHAVKLILGVCCIFTLKIDCSVDSCGTLEMAAGECDDDCWGSDSWWCGCVFKERDDDDDEHFVDVVVDEDDDNDNDASSAMATTTAAAAERADGDADRLSASSSSWVHRNNLACMLHTRIITISFLCLCPSEAKAICYQIVRQSVRVCVLTSGQMHSWPLYHQLLHYVSKRHWYWTL